MKTIKPYYGVSPMSSSSGPKGSSTNPYTQEEFDQMVEAGTWEGGYVEGMGYCMGQVTVTASYPDSSSSGSDDSWPSEDSEDKNDHNPPTPPTPPTGGGGSSHGGGTGGGNTGGGNYPSSIYNVSKAVNYLTAHAYPYYIKDKCGNCAKAVRLALEAGGLSTVGHPDEAREYDTFLPSLGFYKVNKNNYVPQKGDIIVLEAVENHPHGHIAMYSGNKWISDFVQSDMWGGPAYRNKAEYTILRR